MEKFARSLATSASGALLLFTCYWVLLKENGIENVTQTEKFRRISCKPNLEIVRFGSNETKKDNASIKPRYNCETYDKSINGVIIRQQGRVKVSSRMKKSWCSATISTVTISVILKFLVGIHTW